MARPGEEDHGVGRQVVAGQSARLRHELFESDVPDVRRFCPLRPRRRFVGGHPDQVRSRRRDRRPRRRRRLRLGFRRLSGERTHVGVRELLTVVQVEEVRGLAVVGGRHGEQNGGARTTAAGAGPLLPLADEGGVCGHGLTGVAAAGLGDAVGRGLEGPAAGMAPGLAGPHPVAGPHLDGDVRGRASGGSHLVAEGISFLL